MIISERYKYIFIGLPFSGSSAITKELINKYDGKEVLTKHNNMQLAINELSLEPKEYFVFGVYRDPVDLLFTRYSKLKLNPDGRFTDPSFSTKNGGYVTEKAIHLSNWIRTQDVTFEEFLIKNSRKFGIILPYDNSFTENSKFFDFVVDFNNLSASFKEALKLVGVPNDKIQDLPVFNKTENKSVRPEIDKRFESKYFGPFYKWNKVEFVRAKDLKVSMFRMLIYRILRYFKSKQSLKRDYLHLQNSKNVKELDVRTVK